MAVSPQVDSWLYRHALVLVALGCMSVMACLYILSKERKARRSTGARTDSSARSFAKLLESNGFDPAIALATYWYLQETQGRRFPILPSDQLERDLCLSAEEIEHTLLALMALLGRKPALGWHRQAVVTVEDLIRVLQASTEQSATMAA